MGDTAVQRQPDDEPSRARAVTPPSPSAAPSSEGADAGQIHLSQREVEQVIARAVELQQDRDVGRGPGLTLDDLQAVAAQVGVDPDLVRRALDDVRLGVADDADDARLARILGPRRVTGAAVVAGTPEEISRAITGWMTTDEGMVLAGSRDGADRWVPDKRLLTQVKHGLKVTRSESALRGLRTVTTRTESGNDGMLVAVEADTSSVRATNAAVLSVSGVIGIVSGVVSAAVAPDSAMIASDVAQFVTGLALPVVAGGGIVAVVHQSWLGQVRRAVAQALDGIAVIARDGEDASPPRAADWRTIRDRWLGS